MLYLKMNNKTHHEKRYSQCLYRIDPLFTLVFICALMWIFQNKHLLVLFLQYKHNHAITIILLVTIFLNIRGIMLIWLKYESKIRSNNSIRHTENKGHWADFWCEQKYVKAFAIGTCSLSKRAKRAKVHKPLFLEYTDLFTSHGQDVMNMALYYMNVRKFYVPSSL